MPTPTTMLFFKFKPITKWYLLDHNEYETLEKDRRIKKHIGLFFIYVSSGGTRSVYRIIHGS